MTPPLTLFQKVWNSHVVAQEKDSPAVLYIDLHLVHEVTSPQAFTGLRTRKLKVRRPEKTVATMDHSIPTHDPSLPILDEIAAKQIAQMETNAKEFGISLYGMTSPHRGIVHVIGPELGLTQPGMTIVCGDSHTSTHGAFGALAFGIGTTEVEHVLATQCLLQKQPKTFEVKIEGELQKGVSAKDIILALLAQIGIGGATGHVFEYRGSAIKNLNMEQRMTICNMSIEGGARAGMIAPDDETFQYIAGREFTPKGEAWEKALLRWKQLPTDDGATFDKTITLNAGDLVPMITYGTNPGMGMKITDHVPDPDSIKDESQKLALTKALNYMGLKPNQPMLGQRIDVVFIGSCTNSRISDLRLAASLMKDRKVASSVRALIVPGSQEIKKQAEQEGLDKIFKSAGAEWREAGCSMCIAMNGDQIESGQYAVTHGGGGGSHRKDHRR
ncbi:MAG: 3-isopropylmalate dehydratase large subunit [Chloroflexi bacterium]|nr:3-isopropylmalate dehydratase large subunit [Chloroflexota bacterium]